MEAQAPNGGSAGGSGGDDDAAILAKIHDALEIVHNPYSPNQSRQDAQRYLEDVKGLAAAPAHGFSLASSRSEPPIVRHYGLSLLEHVIRHKWAEFSDEQADYLRACVLQLSQGLAREDPLYIRNKVAQLWVEVAKRCWAAEWVDMDEMLVRIWQIPGPGVHKELVLYVLETLSDEVFNGDDAVVAVREGALSKACVEIFTPAAVLAETFPNRHVGPDVRFGDEGWLARVSDVLHDCLSGDVLHSDEIQSCAVRCLSVLYSLMPWAIPRAVIASRCVPIMCNGLAAPHVAVQKAALEALHALYSRSNFGEEEFLEMVVPMYDRDFVQLGRRLFEWSDVDAGDIDDDRYQFAKKFSEMVSCLGNYLDRRFSAVPSEVDVQGFLDFLLLVVRSQSLVVSIPVLVTWTRLLQNRRIGPMIAQTQMAASLLALCGSRMIRYENLPEDIEDPTYVLLLEDTDTIPERHAFLGNYRRYSSSIIESIVQLTASAAIYHILRQADDVLQHLYDGQPPLNIAEYDRYSAPVLRVDAHFTVIECALKGYVKWREVAKNDGDDSDSAREKNKLESDLEAWCQRLIAMSVEDPLIRKRILQLLVAFSTTALDKNAPFMLKVLEHILMTWPAPQPEHKVFNDAIKDLQSESMVELQRLASKMPDHLLDVYDQLEAKVRDMIASGTLDEKRQIAYQSFLFIIVHRAAHISPRQRAERLEGFLEPVMTHWKDEGLKRALSSHAGFCELTTLDKAQEYLARKRVHEIGDWGSVPLDAEGLELQKQLEDRQTQLPLRSTKAFLTYSVEKVQKGTAPYGASVALWQDKFPILLLELLQFLGHAHAMHNPRNWTLLPEEMQSIVGRVLTDRFWQAGISEGSKDEFYARVMDKKGTLEGFASSIRGSVRFVRETCYAIIYCMSRLDLQFYGFQELPGPLAHALFTDSFCLSAHQVINLLNLVRYLVDHCPLALRHHFLPPLLATCFSQMDAKVSSEWEKLDRQQDVQSAAEELTEEMKAESILRQLTYTAVVMAADFLDPSRINPPLGTNDTSADHSHPSLRKFCLMQSSIVEPLLLFGSHAIRMHDGRSCGVILRVFRSIVPEFVPSTSSSSSSSSSAPSAIAVVPDSNHDQHTKLSGQPGSEDGFPIPAETAYAVREFISSDVLKACITSLHEPYFVDLQKELGSLIAAILLHYDPVTATPRTVLLSLPGVRERDIYATIDQISRPGINSRQQRSLVLDLLKDLKGVSISEMGRLEKSVGFRHDSARASKRATRSKMAQEFMTAPAANGGGGGGDGHGGGGQGARKDSPDLEGIAGLFNS